ncbi:zinc finger fyve domain-containing 19 [Pyrenophora seminiperda CCB06]|uniref:Zinc finger fyve domain-containing 19 n=1 Tax=Pyrenophora seminiperda CCB06 TaxID=1302712 RepID=A0A3M7LWX6_9PLEO|nr:zinc finger fyve domain-containing 19 [Pyrenophora seminiperda CCB06]
MDTGSEPKSEPPPAQDAQDAQDVQDAQAVGPPSLRRINSEETERPPSVQRTQDGADGPADAESESDLEEEGSDPADRIVDFDWEDLHHRYHEAMKNCHGEEAALMQEWENLMDYFRVWAQSGHEHETGRTYSRLRTRTTFVQNEEDLLEQKRTHYITVVKAFESALSLLKNSGFRC